MEKNNYNILIVDFRSPKRGELIARRFKDLGYVCYAYVSDRKLIKKQPDSEKEARIKKVTHICLSHSAEKDREYTLEINPEVLIWYSGGSLKKCPSIRGEYITR